METRPLPVRALYTINNNPQYILARSDCPVPVTLIPAHLAVSLNPRLPVSSTPHLSYGRTPLRPVLEAVLRSSPELVPNTTRDFTVYVLDPLEAPPPGAMETHATGGVAIGLGYMSLSLQGATPDATVTGTFIGDGLREDALEVILALRETPAIPKPPTRRWVPPDKSKTPFTTAPLPARGSRETILPAVTPPAIIPSYMMASMPPAITGSTSRSDKKPLKRSMSQQEQEQYLLQASGASSLSQPAAGSSTLPAPHQTDATLAPPAAVSDANQAALHALLVALATSQGKNTELLSMLSAIDTSSGQAGQQNNALIEALAKLLSVDAQPAMTPQGISPMALMQTAPAPASGYPYVASQVPFPTSAPAAVASHPPVTLNFLSAGLYKHHHPPATASQKAADDDEIVVLDKENVDPSAFRRRRDTFSSKEKEADVKQPQQLASWPSNSAVRPAPSLQQTSSTPLAAYPGSSGSQNASAIASSSSARSPSRHRSVASAITSTNTSGKLTRKRTLSEFMEEKEREQERKRTASTSSRARAGTGAVLHANTSAANSSTTVISPHFMSDSGLELGEGLSERAPATSPARRAAKGKARESESSMPAQETLRDRKSVV